MLLRRLEVAVNCPTKILEVVNVAVVGLQLLPWPVDVEYGPRKQLVAVVGGDNIDAVVLRSCHFRPEKKYQN